MSQHKISVIVPVFNGASYLKECLDSITSQTISPHEIIVVDDGSTDESKEIINQFSSVHYFTQPNSGVASARNLGLEKSTGDWIAFIDQDDYWSKESLEYRMLYALSNPDFEIVIGQQKLFLDGIPSPPSWLKPELLGPSLDGYLLGCALIKKNLFSAIGPFDFTLRFCSDYDWFFRMKDNGIPFQILDHLVLHKRVHENNESRHSKQLLKELSSILFASIKRKRKSSSYKK